MEQPYQFAEAHLDEIIEANESGELAGWCTACGLEVPHGVDPDASGDPCESCGERAVYGAQELLLYVVA